MVRAVRVRRPSLVVESAACKRTPPDDRSSTAAAPHGPGFGHWAGKARGPALAKTFAPRQGDLPGWLRESGPTSGRDRKGGSSAPARTSLPIVPQRLATPIAPWSPQVG